MAPPHPWLRPHKSTAQLHSAVFPSGCQGVGHRQGGSKANPGRLRAPWRTDRSGGLRSQTHPGPLCPPRLESPTPGGNCSPDLSVAAAPSAPLQLPASGGVGVGEHGVSWSAAGEPREALGTGGSRDWQHGEGRNGAHTSYRALAEGPNAQLPALPASLTGEETGAQ